MTETTTSPSEAAPEFRHLMVDIETMSTHPSNALILSIGITQFHMTESACIIGEALRWRPRLEPQLLHGREVDPKTQTFWAGQPVEAQCDWAHGARQPATEIWTELYGLIKASRIERIWARGDVFDIGNLVTYFRLHGLNEPWLYNQVRDSRTFCNDTPRLRDSSTSDRSDVLKVWQGVMTPVDTSKIVPHTPISDCINQAFDVWRHWDFSFHNLAHHSV